MRLMPVSTAKWKGAVLFSIAGITVLYYIITGTVPSFDMSSIGQSFKDFAQIGVTGVFQASSWSYAFTSAEIGGILSAIMLIITFCLVDLFDTVGTLIVDPASLHIGAAIAGLVAVLVMVGVILILIRNTDRKLKVECTLDASGKKNYAVSK